MLDSCGAFGQDTLHSHVVVFKLVTWFASRLCSIGKITIIQMWIKELMPCTVGKHMYLTELMFDINENYDF